MKVESRVPELLRELAQKRLNAVEALGMQGEANAKREITTLVYDTPESPNYKRTGRLRNSITYETKADRAIVGSFVSYAPYVEYGTSRYPQPRPFLRNAINNHKAEYKALILEILKG